MNFPGLKTVVIRDLAKPWIASILSLSVLLLLGAAGYRITEGWDWGDCFWMVLITITTIGFGEVEPLSAAGRVVTVLIIGGGLVVVQLTLQKLLRLSEMGYFQRMNELRFRRMLRDMKNHIILCGFGRIGEEIVAQLASEGVQILIIETDLNRKEVAESKGMNVLLADATLDETLLLAGIKECRSLVVTLPNDAANLYVILSARGLNSKCRLISRAESEEAANKLKLAGASVVVSPYEAAGRTMAATALRPIAIDFLDLLAGSEYEIEEFLLSHDKSKFEKIRELTLSELGVLNKGGAKILAIRNGVKLIANPDTNTKVEPGQALIALGSKKQLDSLRSTLAHILITSDKVNS